MKQHQGEADTQQLGLESTLRLAINTIPEQVWSALPDGSVDFLNQRWQEYTGHSLEEGLGLGVRTTVHPEDLPAVLDEWDKSVASGGTFAKEARIRRADGQYRWFFMRGVPLKDDSGTIVRWYGTSIDIEDRKRAEEELHESHAQLRHAAEQALEQTGVRLARQSKTLTELTATHACNAVRFEDRVKCILESTARTLDVERVSVWKFSDDRSGISCLDLFENTKSSHSSGLFFAKELYAIYFEALEHDRLIAVSDTLVDERTLRFSDSYLRPNGIGAMLDVPIHQDDVVSGVLCLEHVGGARVWNPDEKNFALSVANLVAAAALDEDRRMALRKLSDNEKVARLVVDTAHDAFVGMGSDGRIVAWNARAEETFGWKREEVIGRSLVQTIVPPSFRDAHIRGMARFHDSAEAPVVGRLLELSAMHRDGREFPIEITITKPVTRSDGFFFGAFLRDISNRRQREEELKRAKNSAEAATRAKSEFLANMSHELRTPLNGVLGYAQLLKRDRNLSLAHREAIDAITQSGTHLLDLINDVLDLSKIEAGKLETEPVATDLHELVVDVRQLIVESAQRKGLELKVDLEPTLPRLVILDGRHLRQILINLMGNAVKFTERGSVVMTIARRDQRLRFDVYDTGIGINPDDLELIFEAFSQTRTGSEEGGTGLGLTISQRLVRAMGGELFVESHSKAGSHFWFEVPLIEVERSAGEQQAYLSDQSTPDMRLIAQQDITALVVDDDSINRRILAVLLQSMGVHTITACDGSEGICLARKHRPEVILMDLRMKDMDGIEATRRLQADPTTSSIPVIAITASAFDDDREAAFAAGCREFLAKPVRTYDLVAALERQLSAQFETVTGSYPTADRITSVADTTKALALVGDRLRDALSIGSISDLHAIAEELIAGDDHQAALGKRIIQLTNQFEFDEIERLAFGGS